MDENMDREQRRPPPQVLFDTVLSSIPPHLEVRASVLQDGRSGEIYASIGHFYKGRLVAFHDDQGRQILRQVSVKGDNEIEIVRRMLWELERAMAKHSREKLNAPAK